MTAAASDVGGSGDPGRRAVLVTGAGGGLGESVAHRLRRDGCDVIGWDLRASPGVAPVDVSDARMVHAAARELPALAGVVNCAGITSRLSIADSTAAEFARVIAVNLLGTFHVGQASFPALERGRGVFIGLGSVQGSSGFRDRSAYGASKAAVASLVRSMAVEWGPAGVRAVCVSPGYTTVGMSAQAAPLAQARARIPNGRLVEGDEIVDVIAFLLSPFAAAVTGIEIPVDNGFSAYSGM